MPNDIEAVLPSKLEVERLYRVIDLSSLRFETTADLEPLAGMEEQKRARDAIAFGSEIAQRGFNIFVIGAPGGFMRQAVKTWMEDAARSRPLPADWVYVTNFEMPQKPVAIALPGGLAPVFAKAIHNLSEEFRASLPAIFESEDYQKRRASIEQSIQGKNERAFTALTEKALAQNIAIIRTPMGFGLAPIRDGKVVPPADFSAWPEEEQQATRETIAALEKELEETLRSVPRVEKERREAIDRLARETAQLVMQPQFADIKTRFGEIAGIGRHVDAMQADMLDNLGVFLSPEAQQQARMQAAMSLAGPFDRYEVNVLVTQADHASRAPVVEELNPTLGNLLGRIEHLQIEGALVTNFRLIKAGALHRANGGAILLDCRALLSEPFSWAALKRALQRQEIVIEDIARFVGLTTTVSLEPDPIHLDVKIVLVGDRLLYYLLAELDPELTRYFKVIADFDDDMTRTAESEAMLARLIASRVAQDALLPIGRDGVGRLIEHAARLAEDAEKLSLRVDRLHDLMAEADHLARRAGHDRVTRVDVEAAIAQQIARVSRLRERSKEMALRDIARIDTSGSRLGQVNGLSVLSLGGYAFGRPSRITCTVHPGAGKIVDIEREVELGGPLHSKGVLILSGFIAGRYALDVPVSLHASLVFEQSYGGVDGDSASSAELYALLSALADLPLRQDLAVTGSVDQHGIIQAIGGVNEKIEGFFDLCAARGLTGTQGVLIPQPNVQHLMLRQDVVEACGEGRFAIWPVRVIDEGLALLTGNSAGARSADGAYPEGSVNQAVEARLRQFAAARKEAVAAREEAT